MPVALDQRNSGILKLLIRNAEFASFFSAVGGKEKAGVLWW